jgi:hypothetical protein
MDEKQKNSSLRRYNFHINESNQTNSNHQQQQQQLIPISTSATISHKRRRSSITNEQTQLPSNNQDFIYDRNLTMTNAIGNRKRSAQDDLVTYTTHHFLREHEQYVRIKYSNINLFYLFRLLNELDMNNRIVLN